MLGGVIFISQSLCGVPSSRRDSATAYTLFEVEDSEGAYVPETIDVNREFAEEVYDAIAAFREGEPEHQRGEYDTQNLLEEDDDFHLIQLRELALDLVGVETVFPLLRHVVRVVDDVAEGVFRVEDLVVRGDGAVGDGPEGAHYAEVEEDCAVGGDFETEEEFGVDDGGEGEDGDYAAGYEGDESCYLDRHDLRELLDVARSEWVGHVYAVVE